MAVPKTGKGTSPKKATVSNEVKESLKNLDEEREFLAKTLGELLAWYWWKMTNDARHSKRKDVLANQ